MKKLLIIFTILMSIFPAFGSDLSDTSFENCVSITAPAVSVTDEGYVGAAVDIDVKVSKGEGHAYMDTLPLTDIDMQGSARIASKVAFDTCGISQDSYDVYYIIRSDVPTVGGPSAGAVLSVATIAAINNWTLNQNVMMTGMIGPDGTVGPVGGILEKINVGAEKNVDYFLIPYGQRYQIDENNNSVDCVEYGKNLGINVIEVSNVYDAVYYFTNHKINENYEKNPIIDDKYNNIMEKLSEITLESAKKSLDDINNLDLSKLNSSEKEEFEDDLKTASNLIYLGNELHSNSNYYAATSRSFNSLVILETLQSKYSYSDNVSVKNYLSGVNESINEKRNFLSNVTLTKNNVEYVFSAKSRVYEASELMDEAFYQFEEENLSSAIEYASYAKLRAETGIWWLELAPKEENPQKIDEKDLKYLAREYLDNSEIVVVYTSTVLSEELASYPLTQIDDSIKLYNEKEYLLSMSKSIDAYVYATTLLDYGTDVDYLSNLAQKKINKAENCVLSTENNSEYIPVSALSYFEYAENLDDKYSKILYFKYSIAYAQMNMDILKEFDSSALNYSEENLTSNYSENLNSSYFGYDYKTCLINITYLITGLVSGILIGVGYRKNN
ncbi:S16 family serine protease [Methanococcus sp. CF]